MGVKVAIVGLAPDRSPPPWGDSTWEKWGFPWGDWTYLDRWFDIHSLSEIKAHNKTHPGYIDRLKESHVPLIMQEAYFPSAIQFPLKEVTKITGDYFSCSLSYMVAMAIYEEVEHIGFYGVTMSDGDYQHQRPNMEYLIGLARGKGITVDTGDSPLVKYENIEGYKERYGYL